MVGVPHLCKYLPSYKTRFKAYLANPSILVLSIWNKDANNNVK